MHKYPTNLTDKQWQVIKNMLDPKERFRKYSLRSVFDGILYIVKTGVQWRMPPRDSVLLFQQVEERGLAGRDLRHPPRHCPPSFGQG